MIAGEVRSLRLQTLILGIDRCNLLGTVGAGELVRVPLVEIIPPCGGTVTAAS